MLLLRWRRWPTPILAPLRAPLPLAPASSPPTDARPPFRVRATRTPLDNNRQSTAIDHAVARRARERARRSCQKSGVKKVGRRSRKAPPRSLPPSRLGRCPPTPSSLTSSSSSDGPRTCPCRRTQPRTSSSSSVTCHLTCGYGYTSARRALPRSKPSTRASSAHCANAAGPHALHPPARASLTAPQRATRPPVRPRRRR